MVQEQDDLAVQEPRRVRRDLHDLDGAVRALELLHRRAHLVHDMTCNSCGTTQWMHGSNNVLSRRTHADKKNMSSCRCMAMRANSVSTARRVQQKHSISFPGTLRKASIIEPDGQLHSTSQATHPRISRQPWKRKPAHHGTLECTQSTVNGTRHMAQAHCTQYRVTQNSLEGSPV